MAERTRSTEAAGLLERGGLTPEHWQFIARNLPKRSKPRRLAEAILAGLVNSNDSHQYLGENDWNVIWAKHLRYSFEGNDIASQIVNAAGKMKYEVINLNEYFDDL